MQPAPGSRYLTLDHWRGIACLSVLANHAVWFPTGSPAEQALAVVAQRLWIGVPVFFVISGYCITAAVDSHRRAAGRPLSVYFTRRLRRIFPPYWAMLLATLFLVAVIDLAWPNAPLTSTGEFLRPWWYDLRQWIGNLSLTELWRTHVLPGQKALMLGHVWTLCYEEQFYIVAGLLLWLVPGHFLAGASAVTIGTLLVTAAASPAAIEGFFFDGSWFQFWYGVLVYFAVTASRLHRSAALLILATVAAWTALDWQALLEPDKNPAQALLIASVFAMALILLHRHDAAIASARWLRPIQACGVMCYSLYLVHLPVIKILRGLLASNGVFPSPFLSLLLSAPLCLAIAWAFHRTVERRFLNQRSPIALGSPAVPAVLGGV